MDEEEIQRRIRDAEQSFLGRHSITIIVVTVSALLAAVILSLIA